MVRYFTKQGLELKLRQIKIQEEVVRATGREVGQEAGINCDWHDNFGYEDAKRRLELESSILATLRDEVAGAQVIAVEEQSEKVKIGVTVKVLLNGEERWFTIGAYGESDPANGLISYTSPLSRILLEMEPGDSQRAMVGGRTTEVQLESIFPPSYRYRRLIAELTSGNGLVTTPSR